MTCGFNNNVMFASNADFTGTFPVSASHGLISDGQLWIGNSSTQRPTVGSLTSTGGTLTITSGHGTINLEVAGGQPAVETLTGDTGGAVLPNANHNINIKGQSTPNMSGIKVSGTTNELDIAMFSPFGGTVATPNGSFTFNNTLASAALGVQLVNQDTNAASYSFFNSSVTTASNSDPFLHVGIASVANYCWGIDNSSTSHILRINYDANFIHPRDTSGTHNLWNMTTAGQRTMPQQPSFLYFLSPSTTNVTGDGTTYTVPFNTKQFEQPAVSNFNTTTGVFTAPVAGNYLLTTAVQVNNLTSSFTQILLEIVTTQGAYSVGTFKPSNFETNSGSNSLQVSGSIVANMAANDTAKVNLIITGSTKTVGVSGGKTGTNFSGCLLC